MKVAIPALLISVATLRPSPGAEGERTWNFDSDRPGAVADGFTAETGEWKVVEAADEPRRGRVFEQAAESPSATFNIALAAGTGYRDLDLSVALRAVSGKIDQGGGLVWRARDAKNYYLARYNPLEENFRVYKVVDGKRTQLDSAKVDLGPGWHQLRVTMKGPAIECWLDGKKHLELSDSAFEGLGRIGLWTKADARTHFDELRVSDSPRGGGGEGGAAGGGLDAARISEASGAKAAVQPDGVVRISWPRADLKVKVDGVPLRPFAGLTSWAAFCTAPGGAMVMGDTVVLQDEVSPAIDAAFAAGLEVSALHNHFFFDEPNVYFLHIGGNGDPVKLAAGVKGVWEAIRKVRAGRPEPAEGFGGSAPAPGALDAEAIGRALGGKGETQDGVVKVTIGREGTMHGIKVGGSMGLTTWAAFSGSDDLAAVDGDFIMTAREVQPVLRALRKANIHVVALHNHMIGETPPFYFTHFWGKGRSRDLARGLRSALDAQREAASAGGEH